MAAITVIALVVVGAIGSISFLQFQDASSRAASAIVDREDAADALELADKKLGTANAKVSIRDKAMREQAGSLIEIDTGCALWGQMFCELLPFSKQQLQDAEKLLGEGVTNQGSAERAFDQAVAADSAAEDEKSEAIRDAATTATAFNSMLIVGGSVVGLLLAATVVTVLLKRRGTLTATDASHGM